MKEKLLFLLLFFVGFTQIGRAQETKRSTISLKQKMQADTTTKMLAPKPEVAIDFPNLNEIPYFEDPKLLRSINKYERRKDWKKALPLLEEYVTNFGIENFYKDNNLLWRLGQLYERTGNADKAKAMYRLVLKHHRSDIRKVVAYYDSIEAKNADLYVPLKYYYELVEYRKSIKTFHPPKGVYTNMGKGVNSKHEDYGPSISADRSKIIFSSKRVRRKDIQSTANEDLFYIG